MNPRNLTRSIDTDDISFLRNCVPAISQRARTSMTPIILCNESPAPTTTRSIDTNIFNT